MKTKLKLKMCLIESINTIKTMVTFCIPKNIGSQTSKLISNQIVKKIYRSTDINVWSQLLYAKNQFVDKYDYFNEGTHIPEIESDLKVQLLTNIKPDEYINNKTVNCLNKIVENRQPISMTELISIRAPFDFASYNATHDISFIKDTVKNLNCVQSDNLKMININKFLSYIHLWANFDCINESMDITSQWCDLQVNNSKNGIRIVKHNFDQTTDIFAVSPQLDNMHFYYNDEIEIDVDLCEEVSHSFNNILDEIMTLEKQ